MTTPDQEEPKAIIKQEVEDREIVSFEAPPSSLAVPTPEERGLVAKQPEERSIVMKQPDQQSIVVKPEEKLSITAQPNND